MIMLIIVILIIIIKLVTYVFFTCLLVFTEPFLGCARRGRARCQIRPGGTGAHRAQAQRAWVHGPVGPMSLMDKPRIGNYDSDRQLRSGSATTEIGSATTRRWISNYEQPRIGNYGTWISNYPPWISNYATDV